MLANARDMGDAGTPAVTSAVGASAAATASSDFLVVFCGPHFGDGFAFTREAAANLVDEEVHMRVEQLPTQVIAGNEAVLARARVLVPFMTPVDAAMLDAAPLVRLVIQFGVGLEGVDVHECTRRGVHVSNIPAESTGNAASCAEHAVYLALALARKQRAMDESVARGLLGSPTGLALFGRTALIYGCGALGEQVARRLAAFDMRVLAVRRSRWGCKGRREGGEAGGGGADALPAGVSEGGSPEELGAFAARADLVVLTCTQNESTRRLVDDAFLAKLKPGALLINIARGGLVDYTAVSSALDSGTLGGFGTDVFDTEPFPLPLSDAPHAALLRHPRVVATPHVAGVTDASYRTMARVVVREVQRVARGEPPTVRINEPRGA